MTSVSLESHLEQLGFAPEGVNTFRADRLALLIKDGWAALSAPGDIAGPDVLSLHFDRPGLWKAVRVGTQYRPAVDLPLAGPNADTSVAIQASRAIEIVKWAMDSLHGTITAGWQPPDRAEVSSWIAPGMLTVQRGGHARQITLRHESQRLALRVPLVADFSTELSEARQAWLREVLIDTQNRYRMVRIGVADDGERSPVMAEVDLTGAPPSSLEHILGAGLEALRAAVRWSVLSADILTDTGVGCRACEVRRTFHT